MNFSTNFLNSLEWSVDYYMCQSGTIVSAYSDIGTIYQNTVTGEIWK